MSTIRAAPTLAAISRKAAKSIDRGYALAPATISRGCSRAAISAIAEGFRSLANLYVELSHVEGTGGVEKLAAEIGAESIIFGTHAPYQYADAALLKMRESALSEEQQAAVLYGNAERWMGRR